MHALASDGTIITQRDSYPGLSNMPFTRMLVGEYYYDVYPLPLPNTQVAALRIGIYKYGSIPNTWERLNAVSKLFDVQDNAVTIPSDSLN